jgi:FtsH-binding integral membrane protein
MNLKFILKRVFRVAAFALGAGLTGLGAGSVVGLDTIQSAVFGALMGVLGVIAATAFIFAGKGRVSDEDFDATINSAIETVRSKENKK